MLAKVFAALSARFSFDARGLAKKRSARRRVAPFRVTRKTLIAFAAFLGACGSLPRDAYTPFNDVPFTVEGLRDVRIWADASPQELAAQTRPIQPPVSRTDKPVALLALSGGGSAAAYGAGLLAGWTERRDRPTFDVVTGVSAGALIAPFAFLGSDYDEAMIAAFSPSSTERLGNGVTPFRVLFRNSISSNSALNDVIERSITPQLLRDIAREHGKGRRLLILTTNLDAQRAVVWDMGAIAASGNPNALAVFRRVLLASASVPGVYPAVRFDVETPTTHYQELHADGGIFEQVFIGPEAILTGALPASLPKARTVDLYLIINNSLDSEFEVTKDSILGVVGRSYETIIKSHAHATVNTAYLFSRVHGLRFHLAYIREQVPYDYRHPFAREYVDALLQLGYRNGLHADWLDRPPTGLSKGRRG